MALKTNIPGERLILDESFEANEDLSSSAHRMVVSAGSVTSGKNKAGLPSGQGVFPLGALLNDPAIAEVAEVRMIGEALLEAVGTFNAGIQVTIADSAGLIGAASSGDFVIGIAKESANEANQFVTVILNTVNSAQLN